MKKKDKRIANLTRYVTRQAITDGGVSMPSEGLACCIVIPAYHEIDLILTLNSIDSCDMPKFIFEVIIVLNSSEACDETIRVFHREQQEELNNLSLSFPIHTILLEKIPAKKAGVGYARKTGMDVAASRLLNTAPIQGIIVCLDGDCHVSKNYLCGIQNHFQSQLAKQAAHLYFEHPFPEEVQLKNSIIHYELHLRLMKLFLNETGHPQAFHAVGSCLAVRAWAYAAQGGMNSRQAGEDFYFIHKFSAIGQLEELNSIAVYPSSRQSNRVPFGTGAAVNKNMDGQEQRTYNPKSYIQIKRILDTIPEFYAGNNLKTIEFLGYKEEVIRPKLDEIRNNTTSLVNFRSRFFQWFDSFQVFKFLHYLRDIKYPDVEINQATTIFFNANKIIDPPIKLEAQLLLIRDFERKRKD